MYKLTEEEFLKGVEHRWTTHDDYDYMRVPYKYLINIFNPAKEKFNKEYEEKMFTEEIKNFFISSWRDYKNHI